jgi:cytochrome oxidase Cu insertion factor (SCO1/SenC/PrrC family)
MRSGEAGDLDARDAQYAVAALAAILVITVGWWALALWPAPGNPEWLERARLACFNMGADGLPDASGWLLLVGQPLAMVTFLALVWPREVSTGLVRIAHGRLGRGAIALSVLILVAGASGAVVRVTSARAARAPRPTLPAAMTADEHPRLDRVAASLDLVDHRGQRVTLDSLKGRPAIVTFAFANCHDICPVVVAQARAAREATWARDDAALVIVTLDPWRDTPDRLPALASRWALDGDRDYVLGGSVDEVETVLDAWNVARTRDASTGQVAHPPLTYLLDARGRIAFVTLSGYEVLRGLAERLASTGRPAPDGAARAAGPQPAPPTQ